MNNQSYYRLVKLATRYNILSISWHVNSNISLVIGRGGILADAPCWAWVRHVWGKRKRSMDDEAIIPFWRIPFLMFEHVLTAILSSQLGVPWKGPITTSKGRDTNQLSDIQVRLLTTVVSGHEQAGVYFDEVVGNVGIGATRYVPRSVQVDLEAGVCNKVCRDVSSERVSRLILCCWKLRSGILGALFRPDTYLTSNSGAGNNWAKGCEYLVL